MDDYIRPDPDQLLSVIKNDEADKSSGKLKLFLGMAAGVGKTFAMLSQAHNLRRNGVDVVVGWVDTHGRADTAALLTGLEQLPRRSLEHGNTALEEFDLDLALRRKPKVVIVDELAHTNVAGSRHGKRYLDVLELLKAGIDVYTAVNIQHLESRIDTVREITGVSVRETIPDLILDRANEIVLIDLPPEDLLKRLAEGKIYGKERADVAARNFFRPGNLIALRELALRLTAERVDKDVRSFKTLHGIESAWKSGARLMVAVYASPFSEALIRRTRRLADSLNGSWIGVYVQAEKDLSAKEEQLLAMNMDLVRQLSGEMITTKDDDPVTGLMRVARQNNVTQVILGKSRRSAFGNWIRGGSVADRMSRASGDIDVFTMAATSSTDGFKFTAKTASSVWRIPAEEVGQGFATLVLTWLIAAAMRPMTGYMAVGVLFLIAVNVASLYLSRFAVIALACAFALIHNFFFIPPLYSLSASQPQDLILLAALFIAAMVTGSLTGRLRRKEHLLNYRERLNGIFFKLARTLSATTGMNEVIRNGVEAMEDSMGQGFTVFARESADDINFSICYPIGSNLLLDEKESAVKEWVQKSGEQAGRGTQTLAAAKGLFLPVKGPDGVLAVIAFQDEKNRVLTVEERSILDTIISILSPAIGREFLSQAQIRKQISDESEKLYRTLLDSVSHELKTPLVSIKGAGSVLKDEDLVLSPEICREMAAQIVSGAERLQQVVDDLLDMTRLESGMFRARIEVQDIYDIVTHVLSNFDEKQKMRVRFSEPLHSVLVLCDGVLMTHALLNVIRNALMYSPPETIVEILIKDVAKEVEIQVRDLGPGISNENKARLFEKFYRHAREKSGGLGLGLSIARGFIELQRGRIQMSENSPQGSIFSIFIPSAGEAML